MTLNHTYEPIHVRDSDDRAVNPTDSRPFAEILETRLARRSMLRGLAAVAAAGAIGATLTSRLALATGMGNGLTFKELGKGNDETFHVAEGYRGDVLIRWGDPVVKGAPAFDPTKQTAKAQAMQFGYNCDFIAFQPLPRGSAAADHGLLAVNHEYTEPGLMFPGIAGEGMADKITREMVDIELAAHGMSIVEIRREDGRWQLVKDSRLNRRITMETEMMVSGPAAGHDRLKTSADRTGKKARGTVNNCAGGVTPWGTVLTAEENFHQYFAGDPAATPEAANHKRLGLEGKPEFPWWGKHHARFDVTKEPNEPNRFGWIVEIDPYDPKSMPVKRTALGRFKHEGATTLINKDGRLVVYSGDDQRFEYVYRFVSEAKVGTSSPAANRNLLDKGTLSVAKFGEDGTLAWMPLVYGRGPLTAANGFNSQGDVLIDTRRAADLLGATPMDRPEEIEANPVSGVVYAIMTNNNKRKLEQIDKGNPRADNKYGHILELIPAGGRGKDADHAAEIFTWDVFILAGDPTNPEHKAMYPTEVSADGWFVTPDNCTFDSKGRLWIATDGAASAAGFADGIWACEVDGPQRGLTKHFLHVPKGAEMCGPCFTADDTSLFVAVQHPGEGSSFEKPVTRWPDFSDALPPRPSVVAVTRDGGGTIGG